MVDFGSDLRKRTLVLCAALALAIAVSVLLRGRRRVNVLFAAQDGVVSKVLAAKGDSLAVDQPIVEFA